MILTVSQREKKKFYRLRVPFWCCISYIYSKCMRKTVSIEWRFMFTLHRIQNKRKKTHSHCLLCFFFCFSWLLVCRFLFCHAIFYSLWHSTWLAIEMENDASTFGSFVLILLLSRVKYFIGFILLSFGIRLSFWSCIPFTCCTLCANTIKTNQTNKRLRWNKAKKECRMKHCVMSVLKSNFHCNIHIFAHFMRQK